MKKFLKGTFEVDKNVVDLNAYENQHKNKLDYLNNWCSKHDIQFLCGTADDNTYLIEYKIVANTKSMCKGLQSELKAILKNTFPYCKTIWEAEGHSIW